MDEFKEEFSSIMKKAWESTSSQTTKCYRSILGQATSPQPCHLFLLRYWAKYVVWPGVAIFMLYSVCILEYILSSTIYRATQTSLTSRMCIGSYVERTWMKLEK